MNSTRKTAIVTGASQGIGAGIVTAFVERGFNVVANSLKVTQSTEVAASDRVALVEGDIGDPVTAARIVEVARSRFQSIDVPVNNTGIFLTKPFTDSPVEDFRSLVSTRLWPCGLSRLSFPPARPANVGVRRPRTFVRRLWRDAFAAR